MKAMLICAALTAASLTLSLTGCAGVSTDVRAAPADTRMQGEHSYALVRSPLQDGLPDHMEYETLIRAELVKYDFADVARERAHYLLSIAYDTRLAAIKVKSADCAQQGCSGGGEGAFSLFGRHAYQHSLTLRFFEQTSGSEVYTVSAVSEDHDADPLHAIPYLVKSALAQFPFADHADWRVKLRADAADGSPKVVSMKPVQP
ncbi:hypothetical protein P3T43_002895 [Paraburkholderia sp. GAS41]|jgi:hypothetical protein|uniref:DUF4136 domain-containing protein n=1 Tax=Paraburkholderia sp. GAS41 TaxID=3035134 RepID=UPI003D1D3723